LDERSAQTIPTADKANVTSKLADWLRQAKNRVLQREETAEKHRKLGVSLFNYLHLFFLA